MRGPARLLLLAAALLAAAVGAAASGERTLTGMYTSGYQDRPATVRAVFTPEGDGRWQVIFYCRHAGRPHSYRGLAEGDLGAGELRGRVRNESGNRTFTFRCRFEDGRCKGTHAEVGRGGREHRTGTITLRP